MRRIAALLLATALAAACAHSEVVLPDGTRLESTARGQSEASACYVPKGATEEVCANVKGGPVSDGATAAITAWAKEVGDFAEAVLRFVVPAGLQGGGE